MKLFRCRDCGWEVYSTLAKGKCDLCGGELEEVSRNVLTAIQDESGHFNINLVTQQGEYNNIDIAHWAFSLPLALPENELLDIITLLSRAIMHINPWPKIPEAMQGYSDWRVPHESDLLQP